MKDKDYKETAKLIELIESFLIDLGDDHFESDYKGNFYKPGKKLAGKIFLEWSKSLKKVGKEKDKKLSDLLLAFSKYLI